MIGWVVTNLDRIFKFTNVETDSLTFAGGASKGELWCQTLADVTGKEIKVPNVTEATALGGAMAIGTAIGIYDSIETISSQLIKWKKSYQPNMKNFKKYKEIRNKWAEAYKVQLDLVDKGITSSMWKAPGL